MNRAIATLALLWLAGCETGRSAEPLDCPPPLEPVGCAETYHTRYEVKCLPGQRLESLGDHHVVCRCPSTAADGGSAAAPRDKPVPAIAMGGVR